MKTNKKIEIFELYNPSHPTQKKKKKEKEIDQEKEKTENQCFGILN
jgi:hypothetical protein